MILGRPTIGSPSIREEASDAVFAILSKVTPLIEPLSLDKAFLDVTASVKLFGTPSQMASDLRARIAAEVGLPSSAGIASVKFVAKIASDLAKPNVFDMAIYPTLFLLYLGRLWPPASQGIARRSLLAGDGARIEPAVEA